MLQWPSLTERRVGGVHPSRLHESVFLYVLQLKRLRVRTVVSGVLLYFILVIMWGINLWMPEGNIFEGLKSKDQY